MLPEQRDNLSRTELEWIHPPEVDGLAISMLRLPSSTTSSLVHTAGSIGCFVVVMKGTIRFGDRQMSTYENVFISSDIDEFEYSNGTEPAELLMLHFPPTDSTYDL